MLLEIFRRQSNVSELVYDDIISLVFHWFFHLFKQILQVMTGGREKQSCMPLDQFWMACHVSVLCQSWTKLWPALLLNCKKTKTVVWETQLIGLSGEYSKCTQKFQMPPFFVWKTLNGSLNECLRAWVIFQIYLKRCAQIFVFSSRVLSVQKLREGKFIVKLVGCQYSWDCFPSPAPLTFFFF